MERVSFSLHEVLTAGFEARCVGVDGARYLWCQGSGLRVDPCTHVTTLVGDPSALPEAGWTATRFGLQQLAEARDGEDAVLAQGWAPELQ